MALNVLKLDSSLDPPSFQESRIENRVSSIGIRETVNLHLSGTVVYFYLFHFENLILHIFLIIIIIIIIQYSTMFWDVPSSRFYRWRSQACNHREAFVNLYLKDDGSKINLWQHVQNFAKIPAASLPKNLAPHRESG